MGASRWRLMSQLHVWHWAGRFSQVVFSSSQCEAVVLCVAWLVPPTVGGFIRLQLFAKPVALLLMLSPACSIQLDAQTVG